MTMTTVFLSYSRDDQTKVSAIYELLKADGYDVFMDTNIDSGANFRKRINTELQRAKCIVGFWSETSVTSEWVIDETNYAKLHGNLVPVMLDNAVPPMGFGNLNAAILRDSLIKSDSEGYIKLRKAIDMVINGEFETESPLQKELEKILDPLPNKDYREFRTQQGDLNNTVAEAVNRLVEMQNSQIQLNNAQTAKIEASTRRWEIIVYPSLFAFIILIAYTFFLVYSLTSDIHAIARATDQNLPMLSGRSHEISNSMSVISRNTQSIAIGIDSLSIKKNGCLPEQDLKMQSSNVTPELE